MLTELDPHVEKAIIYAQGVVDGDILACKFVKQACKRQLDDLERFRNHPIFYFDQLKAGHVCRFIERLPHVKGQLAKKQELIRLEPWQCFILTTVFGWYRHDTGGRRYRRVYIEVPRGNAKSTLSSGVGLYCLAADGEEGAEVYSAATKRDQAKIVFGDARQMLRKREEFASTLGIVVNQNDLVHYKTNSKFVPLSRDYGSMDGLNIHCGIIDELHAHKDRGIYDVLETGAGKRTSSLIWNITTAGVDISGICYEQRKYVVKLLDRVLEDESYFGIIYTIDVDDNWQDPKVWPKANPNWGVSVMPDSFTQLATKAMQLLSAQNNFKTKHLNIWCQSETPWMDMRHWDKCFDQDMSEQMLIDMKARCFAGLDLTSKVDLAAWVRLYLVEIAPAPEVEDLCKMCSRLALEHRLMPRPPEVCERFTERKADVHVYGFVTCYLPEQALNDGRNASYQGWEAEGRIKTNPGDVLDYDMVEEDILATMEALEGRLAAVGFDPWQAQHLANNMLAKNVPMVEVRATVENFSLPMKEWEALIKSGHFHHDGNPVYGWAVSNVVCHFDVKDNIYPRKEKPEQKIDPAVATIIAMNQLTHREEEVYSSTRGIRTL